MKMMTPFLKLATARYPVLLSAGGRLQSPSNESTCLIGWLVFLIANVSGSAAPGEPTSGFIATSEYGINKDGEAVGQKRTNRVWFQGHNSRSEMLIGDDLVEVVVGGDRSWSAAPAAGRILIMNEQHDDNEQTPPPTYPDIVRQRFARTFGAHPQVGSEDLKSVPCWKYAWREEGLQIHGVGSAAQNMSYWVYADAGFPFVLARKSDIGGNMDLLEFRLNVPVPADAFIVPESLKPVLPFRLPKAKFLIELEEDRQSTRNGWKTHSTKVFKSDGDTVTTTFTSLNEQNGKTDTFSPPSTTLTYEKAGDEIANRLQTAMWMSVRKTGSEQILNTTADLLENIVGGLPDEKSWVADHPQLGTICLRRITRSPDATREQTVTKLEIEAPPAEQ